MKRLKIKKLKHDVKREAAKISASSSGKIDKNDDFTSEEILSPDQNRKIEQAQFTFPPHRKALEKQTKTIED